MPDKEPTYSYCHNETSNFIRESLLKQVVVNPLNVVLHSHTYPGGASSGPGRLDTISLEQDIKHFYNKVSYQINRKFREAPVMTLVGFIEKSHISGLHAHILIEPPEQEEICIEDFRVLINTVWPTTRHGKDVKYNCAVKNWAASVLYNCKSRTKKQPLSESIVHYGKPYWAS